MQAAEFLKRAKFPGRIGAVDSVADMRGYCPVNVLGEAYAALDIFLFLRALQRLFVCHAVMNVAVKLIKGDVAITVKVGLASP